MSILTAALFNHLAGDGPLTAMLTDYKSGPGIFTIDPVPGDAVLPYIVTAGEVTQTPWDTKNTRGRFILRDVRIYAPADGSVVLVEAIAERVRSLLHRQTLTIAGFKWIISDVSGPIVADEPGVYGRILTLSLKAQEE
jgi:hypothetical protein